MRTKFHLPLTSLWSTAHCLHKHPPDSGLCDGFGSSCVTARIPAQPLITLWGGALTTPSKYTYACMRGGRRPISEGYRRCSDRTVEALAMQSLRGYIIKLHGMENHGFEIESCRLWTCSSLHKSAWGYAF